MSITIIRQNLKRSTYGILESLFFNLTTSNVVLKSKISLERGRARWQTTRPHWWFFP